MIQLIKVLQYWGGKITWKAPIAFSLLLIGVCYAGDISQPPVDKQLSVQTGQFLKSVSDNFNNLVIVTSSPDGNRTGRYGDEVIFKATGSVYYIATCISSPSGTVWRGVQLSALP